MYIRCVRFEDVCDAGNNQASDKPIVPDVLPALLHVLLTGLDAEEIPTGRVVVVAMVRSTQGVLRRETTGILRLSEKTAGAKATRQSTSSHLEICGFVDGGRRRLVRGGSFSIRSGTVA